MRRRNSHETVARGETALYDVALIAVRFCCAGSGCNVQLCFKLIDEIEGHALHRLKPANTKIREIGGEIGHPSHIANRRGAIRQLSAEALGGDIERDVEVAV